LLYPETKDFFLLLLYSNICYFLLDYQFSFFVLFYCNIRTKKNTISRKKENSKQKKKKTIIVHRDCDDTQRHRIIHSAYTKTIKYEKIVSTEQKKRKRNKWIHQIQEKERKRIINSTIPITVSFRICYCFIFKWLQSSRLTKNRCVRVARSNKRYLFIVRKTRIMFWWCFIFATI
jgi:hypothetical protein